MLLQIKYKKYIDYIINMFIPSIIDKHHYTECHRRNGPNFGRVFHMLNYTDITQNTYIQS